MTVKKTARDAQSRAWQRMLSGRRLDLLDPSPLDVEIADIAHGLARVARWNGQTTGAHIFSVAQHTLLVETVLRHEMPRADGLAVPACDARQPVRDVGDLDVERGGIEQVEPSARQHALPGAGLRNARRFLRGHFALRRGLRCVLPQLA